MPSPSRSRATGLANWLVVADELTIIIVALIGGDALESCVQAAANECKTVLLVQQDGAIIDQKGEVVGNAGRLDIPGKRKAAIQFASTEFVGLLEDTVIPAAGWATAALTALAPQRVVAVGGPVAVERTLPSASRALALSEYGDFRHADLTTTPLTLPGCNFAFRRAAVLEAMRESDGLIDQTVFRNLLATGGEFAWSPEMGVSFSHANPSGARLSTRFDHGRIYASTETRNAGPIWRVLRAGKALLLPPVLTWRGLENASVDDWKSPATLAWLALQQAAWAAGEFVGAVMGPSRKGLAQWQ